MAIIKISENYTLSEKNPPVLQQNYRGLSHHVLVSHHNEIHHMW